MVTEEIASLVDQPAVQDFIAEVTSKRGDTTSTTTGTNERAMVMYARLLFWSDNISSNITPADCCDMTLLPQSDGAVKRACGLPPEGRGGEGLNKIAEYLIRGLVKWYMLEARRLARGSCPYLLQLINSASIKRDGINTKPWNPLNENSIQAYADYFTRILLCIIR